MFVWLLYKKKKTILHLQSHFQICVYNKDKHFEIIYSVWHFEMPFHDQINITLHPNNTIANVQDIPVILFVYQTPNLVMVSMVVNHLLSALTIRKSVKQQIFYKCL